MRYYMLIYNLMSLRQHYCSSVHKSDNEVQLTTMMLIRAECDGSVSKLPGFKYSRFRNRSIWYIWEFDWKSNFWDENKNNFLSSLCFKTRTRYGKWFLIVEREKMNLIFTGIPRNENSRYTLKHLFLALIQRIPGRVPSCNHMCLSCIYFKTLTIIINNNSICLK